jgi:hypothetical protein
MNEAAKRVRERSLRSNHLQHILNSSDTPREAFAAAMGISVEKAERYLDRKEDIGALRYEYICAAFRAWRWVEHERTFAEVLAEEFGTARAIIARAKTAKSAA